MDSLYMQIALDEAQKGVGKVNPNPFVGAVIVKNKKIIATGYHKSFGKPHAEVNAIRKVKNKQELDGATLYVTLEPCSHFGKTPPCTDLIIKSKIKRCVIATLDPNPLVAGNGIKKLKDAGIQVVLGVLEKNAKDINRVFFKYIQTKIPYIYIKVGITLDGKIATRDFSSKWITNTLARQKVENYRNKFSSILVGANTVIQDNPTLKCKIKNNRNPYRLILDKDFILNETYNVIKNNDDMKTYVITLDNNKYTEKFNTFKEKYLVKFIFFTENDNLKNILKKIGEHNIDSILVEGGSAVISSFFKQNLYDGGEIIVAPKIIGDSKAIPMMNGFNFKNISSIINLSNVKINRYGDNVGFEFYKEEPCLQD